MRYLSLLLLTFLVGCHLEPRQLTVKEQLLENIDSLETEIVTLRDLVEKNGSQSGLQKQFTGCRTLYKHCEWAVEYFQPSVARFINGPALDEVEADENRFFPPAGFQVVEEMLFPIYDKANQNELKRETGVLLSNIRQIRTHLQAVAITNDYIVDALQQHLSRITALGITGFDSPVALLSIPETAEAMSSIKNVIEMSDVGKRPADLGKLLSDASRYCRENPGFNSFDRAAFISNYLIPIGNALKEFRDSNQIASVPRTNAIRSSAATFFDKNAFDVDAFSPSKEYGFTNEKAQLGKMLFYDSRLSKDQDRSCASCHHPEKAFTDGLAVNVSLTGSNLVRNTPTLTYSAFQNALFWDLRQPDLEKQSADVIANKDEMHGDLTLFLPVVKKDAKFNTLFSKAFPDEKDVKNWQIQNALASYIRSLNAFDSKFDRYVRGEKTAMDRDEITGMNLFMGKAKCATCHFTPLFNGSVPPRYSKTEQEVLGTPKFADGKQISDDPGRFAVTKMPQFLHAYKTPTVRNAAVTAPYMHNGVYKSLEEVVDFYDKGGGTGLGYDVPNQTLPTEKLNLTANEKSQLVAFIKALTDSEYIKNKPDLRRRR
ncbi:cytochrome-c peroxidase [Flavobacterium selenitireducens]|uniref:cytochrome-c peroxidase n=1 Tax=Flavobacterium selenitireducens TaxID=2722704 RepID=UPI00168ABB8C|nr:cytochrome c peroxidase [Flavobacterium selenitireducens]MBD3581478.1 cytochrome-c peroxidase [Flavobacterium selenitireducens]